MSKKEGVNGFDWILIVAAILVIFVALCNYGILSFENIQKTQIRIGALISIVLAFIHAWGNFADAKKSKDFTRFIIPVAVAVGALYIMF